MYISGTMVGTKTTTTTTHEMSYLRKIRKPIVEKKRRERMNNSIEQLKSLIAQTIKQNTAPMTRVDKADILELTVFHLTQLRQQQQSVTLATEAAAYNAGYSACAREAVCYLSNTGSAEVTRSLNNHLHGAMLRQSTVQQTGRSFPHHGSTISGKQTDRLSTPLRAYGSFNSPLPELNLSDFSPIQEDSSKSGLTSSSESSSFNSSTSVDFSSSSSAGSVSFCDVGNSGALSPGYVIEKQKETCVDKCIDVVTIGDGKENEIGHVIKDVIWRPF